MNWFKEHKKIVITAVVLITVAVIVVVAVATGNKKESNVKEETATVERRTLMKSISATGSFVAADEDKVSTDTVGAEIKAVNVQVGDTVAAGDVIAVIDTKDLEEDLANAKEGLQTTQDQAARTRDQATRNLDRAKTDRDENLKQVDVNIADAKADWEKAESNYNTSMAAYNDAVATRDALVSAGNTTSAEYISANTQVNTLKRQLDGDRQTVDAYKTQYDRLVENRADSINQINENYQNQVDTYNNTIDSTKNSGESQQERIDELNKQIQGAVVKANSSGLVTAVNVAVGDRYNGQAIAVIENVDSFDVTTEIGEYDINQVEVGQEVVIKTNATGDDELEGVVKKVSPIATGKGGNAIGDSLGFDIDGMLGDSTMSGLSGKSEDVTFTVTISVNTPCDKLRIGMTAKINIIQQKNKDVLSLPYNAVLTDDNETYYVKKITGKDEEGNYKTKKVKVVKGIESDYYTEIMNSPLKEGDEILLPKAEKGTSLEDMINGSASMGGI